VTSTTGLSSVSCAWGWTCRSRSAGWTTTRRLFASWLGQARTQAAEALAELRSLSRGIAPPILTDRGLEAALASITAPVPGADHAGRRPR